MPGPWEKYQASSDGPWSKYQSAQGGGNPPLGFVAGQVAGMLPQVGVVKNAIQNPETMLPAAGAALGTAVAPGAGTAIGAGLGQIGSRMIDIAKGAPPMSPGQEAIGPSVQAIAGGLPEVSGLVRPGAMNLAQAFGKGMAKAGETLSGVKQDIFQQTAKQGLSTYQAPSMQKAKEVFGAVLGPEGQAALKSSASEAFDPALGQARSLATDVGTKIETGQNVTALEALKARQATDRVISSTPLWDDKTRAALFDWRQKFDNILMSQRGDLKEASDLYRQAVVKKSILNPTRITKSGKPSAFLPMILGATQVGGYGAGHGGKTAEGVIGGLAATSPAVWGLGAATAGSIPGPLAQAAMAELLRRYFSQSQNGQQSASE